MHYKYLDTANETATVDNGPVRLHFIIVGTGAASAVVTVYNGEDTNGDVVAVINGAAIDNVDFGGLLLSGLHVVLTGGNAKVTIIYS